MSKRATGLPPEALAKAGPAAGKNAKILAFGTFDPLHKGHIDFLRQAKELGSNLTVVVARDAAIRASKHYEPYQAEDRRLKRVQKVEYVNETLLGKEGAHEYELLGELEFDILAIGFDQLPTDEDIRQMLNTKGKPHVKIVRLMPFHPELYKGTHIRNTKQTQQ